MTRKILVVDDEESLRYTFGTFLSKAGHAVETAHSWQEASEKIAAARYDLVITDVILGDGTGIDVLKAVREHQPLCPVVVITGFPNLETASDAVRLGAFDYLRKPVLQDDLLRVASLALKHKQALDEKEHYRLNLEAVFRSVKDAIVTVDRDMNLLYANEMAGMICGYSGTGPDGNPVLLQPAGCGDKCMKALSDTLISGSGREIPRFECHQQGRPKKVVSVTTAPLMDSQGAFSGAVLVIRDETRLDELERAQLDLGTFGNMIGSSEAMQKIYSLIEALSDVQTTVLLRGESGTGKELVADAIHYTGSRKDKPLVKVNCSALSESLLESELFGHVKGAFTGAISDKTGRFMRADGGTMFLDEIADISPSVQLRLLRVLQEQTFERVGDTAPVTVDVRVIAATNKDLFDKVRKGEFREDLYYRLKVFEILLPPLREKREDIPQLISHFIEKFNRKFNRNIQGVSDDVFQIFTQYAWPGNVRELEHAIEHAFVLCRNGLIMLEHLPPDIREHPSSRGFHQGRVSEEDERQKIIEMIKQAGGNRSKAARLLGISRRTLYRRISELDIDEGK